MEQKNREKSRVRDIAAEIAHDLGINKALVREVLLLTFKEIAVTLILRGKPIMIRRFVKFVIAMSAIKKIKKNQKKEKEK
jgi:nucleoid DNA-binding protein